MKNTYLEILKMILDELDYRELNLSLPRFKIKQIELRLKNKKGSINKKEIEVIENLCEEFKRESAK